MTCYCRCPIDYTNRLRANKRSQRRAVLQQAPALQRAQLRPSHDGPAPLRTAHRHVLICHLSFVCWLI